MTASDLEHMGDEESAVLETASRKVDMCRSVEVVDGCVEITLPRTLIVLAVPI